MLLDYYTRERGRMKWLEGFDDFDFALFAEEVDVDAAGVAMDQDVAGVSAYA